VSRRGVVEEKIVEEAFVCACAAKDGERAVMSVVGGGGKSDAVSGRLRQ
jgi:ADP-ribosylglycohydrolase